MLGAAQCESRLKGIQDNHVKDLITLKTDAERTIKMGNNQ